MKKLVSLACAAAVLSLASCKQKGWTVEGNIAGGQDTTVYVEASTLSHWYVLDSVTPGSDGAFAYTAPEAAAIPDVYRLRMGDKYIYFPVDSAEAIHVTADAAHFDSGYTLSGNPACAGFVTVDSLISATVGAKGVQNALADPDFKMSMARIVNADTTCLVSYYVASKYVGTTPLLNMKSKQDIRTLANAANNLKQRRPDDPRAAELEARWMQARKAAGLAQPGVQMQANLINRPQADLKRYDRNGKLHDFDAIADRGGVTVLNFTRYDTDASAANNVALKAVYDRYKDAGLQIYQVAYDPDELEWKRSAANMPWIAVYNSPTDDINALVAYNVDPIRGTPVSFVVNRQGEIIERVTDPSKLEAAVAKAM